MRTTRALMVALALALLLARGAAAQEKPKAAEPKPAVPLKILVVFSEFDGEKKISSMPYTISSVATESSFRYSASLRMGLKVPIQSTTKEGQSQMVYMDVGTNIDVRAEAEPDGRFGVNMVVRRSSVQTLEGATAATGEFSGRPVLREFNSSFDFVVRDGQPFQTIVATDPVSGHTLKVEVTLTVVK